jgi:hypothetical protein
VWKDSHVGDPQSWNKYSYARNNPLRYIDPSGEDATVTIETDEENKKGRITIRASIAIWTADDSISQDDLNRSAGEIKKSIESAWAGTYTRDGITYEVRAEIDVSVRSSEKDASKSGAQNVVELTNGNASATADSLTRPRPLLFGPDSGKWNINNLSRNAGHEFGHLLGIGDHEGFFMDTHASHRPSGGATADDYHSGLGGAIDAHRLESRRNEPLLDAEPYKHAQTALGTQYHNYTSSREVRPSRFWWR